MGFWFAYFVGAFTFVPIVCSLIFALAYFTFPTVFQEPAPTGPLTLPTDDDKVFASPDEVARLKRKNSQDNKDAQQLSESKDVAAGYFAVTREYVPGGVNGKPPERPAPNGNLPTESPSVYQTMYRSLFERKPAATSSAASSNNSKGKNVFFVVLRHGHLMLYDDSEQVEVRHVISLTHHSVSIYGGEGEAIPEGELYIKRNAIRLVYRKSSSSSSKTAPSTKPFFLFSENCSEKEDFYFALVKNQEREESKDGQSSQSKPLGFETKHIISLVQRLHSSEEDLQTRWLNGLVGRIFLALYRTNEVEEHIRSKVTKKIARVKRPAFLSNIIVQKIDCGEGAPFITNPKMRELTADGEFSIEGDVKYAGNFRIEISTVATLSLGNRFKPRQVPLVLAVVFKKLEGHAILRIKPPPSNRFWFTFSETPKMDIAVEPIISSRMVTWNLVLRPIENRIKEVIAETLVSPNWDDIPFIHTDNEPLRGGVWESMRAGSWKTAENTDPVAQGSVEDAEKLDKAAEEGAIVENGGDVPTTNPLTEQEKSMSMPVLPSVELEPSAATKPKRSASSASSPPVIEEDKAVSSSVDGASQTAIPRSKSRRSASNGTPINIFPAPVQVATTTVNASAERQEPKYDNDRSDAVSSVMSISRSRSSSGSGPAGGGGGGGSTSPFQTPYGSPSPSMNTVSGLSPSPSVTTIDTLGSVTTAATTIAISDSKSLKSTPSFRSVTSTDTAKSTNTAAENLKSRLGTFKNNFSNISFPKAFNAINNNINNNANNNNGNSNNLNPADGDDKDETVTAGTAGLNPGEVVTAPSPQPSPNPEKTPFATTLAITGVAIRKWYINSRKKDESNSSGNGAGSSNSANNASNTATTVESGFHPVTDLENVEALDGEVKPYPLEAPPKTDLRDKITGFGSTNLGGTTIISSNASSNGGGTSAYAATASALAAAAAAATGADTDKKEDMAPKYKYPVPPWHIPSPPPKRTDPIDITPKKARALPPPVLPPRQNNGLHGRTMSSASSSSLKLAAAAAASKVGRTGSAGDQEEVMVIAAPVSDPIVEPATPVEGEEEVQLQGVFLGNESPEERRKSGSSVIFRGAYNDRDGEMGKIELPESSMPATPEKKARGGNGNLGPLEGSGVVTPNKSIPSTPGKRKEEGKLFLPDYDGLADRRLSAGSPNASVRSNGSRGSRGSKGSSGSERWEMRERPFGRSPEDQAPSSRSWTTEEEEWRWRKDLVSEITGEEG
ncbi:hypothetical protein ABW20_dc0105647 [Dactylellina cionopaga]|nr:hypothetical protein ABW20_dc0105647 [Dactylellina cionopaga]